MSIARFVGTASVAGTPLAVYLTGTQAPADIYADDLLTPLANPFVVDAVTGAYVFYADDAVSYDITQDTGAGEPLPDGPTATDAPASAPYVLLQEVAELPFARALTAGSGITLDTATPGQVILNSTGGGDVTGPASAGDQHLAIFDDVTGKLLADGGMTIAEVLAAGITTAVTSDPVSPAEKQVWYFLAGALPALALSIRIRIGSTTYNIPLATIST